MTGRPGLRERKKQATRKALREAALRLALERGPDNVRVDEIADAAGVSPRTYNNYFSSLEQAIVAAVTAEREQRVAEAVAARSSTPLADAVVDAVVEQYTRPTDTDPRALVLITVNPALRDAFAGAATSLEDPLTDVIAARLEDRSTAQVLAASVAAAVRVALTRWLQPSSTGDSAPASPSGGLVVPTGSLPDLLRDALAPLEPALAAAERARLDRQGEEGVAGDQAADFRR